MKLKKIIVENLFGVFKHEIIIKESGITIVLGENGLGKTVLLEMIEAFFNSNFFYFHQVTFEKMKFEFEDGIVWELEKKVIKDSIPLLMLSQINKNKTTYQPFNLLSFNNIRDMRMVAIRIGQQIPYIRRITPRLWKDKRTGDQYEAEDLVIKFSHQLEYNEELNTTETPKWFSSKHKNIKISLIETQRLISLERKEDKSHEKTVERYSKELSILIKVHLSESTELSSKLDRTYPNRLVKRINESLNVSDEYLNSELIKLEEKRELLDRVGLIEIEKDSSLLEIGTPDTIVREVLMLYVEDSFKKLQIFDKVSRKIELLLEIINKRFKHKKLYIDKEEGFLFKSTIIKDLNDEFQIIHVTKLSSGEQNELVLFYLLLFKTIPNSLILVDEPEVSLHISWQNCFIEDIKAITELNNLDIIIATHSPDIISGNWDLTTELKGIE